MPSAEDENIKGLRAILKTWAEEDVRATATLVSKLQALGADHLSVVEAVDVYLGSQHEQGAQARQALVEKLNKTGGDPKETVRLADEYIREIDAAQQRAFEKAGEENFERLGDLFVREARSARKFAAQSYIYERDKAASTEMNALLGRLGAGHAEKEAVDVEAVMGGLLKLARRSAELDYRYEVDLGKAGTSVTDVHVVVNEAAQKGLTGLAAQKDFVRELREVAGDKKATVRIVNTYLLEKGKLEDEVKQYIASFAKGGDGKEVERGLNWYFHRTKSDFADALIQENGLPVRPPSKKIAAREASIRKAVEDAAGSSEPANPAIAKERGLTPEIAQRDASSGTTIIAEEAGVRRAGKALPLLERIPGGKWTAGVAAVTLAGGVGWTAWHKSGKSDEAPSQHTQRTQ